MRFPSETRGSGGAAIAKDSRAIRTSLTRRLDDACGWADVRRDQKGPMAQSATVPDPDGIARPYPH
jgi:hypothetical protein